MKISLDLVYEELRKFYLAIGKFMDIDQLEEQAKVYHEKLADVESHTFRRACQHWDKDKLPTAIQLLQLCRENQEFVDRKNALYMPSAALVCHHLKYFAMKGFPQSQLEQNLCMQKSISDIDDYVGRTVNGLQNLQNDAIHSQKGYGLVLCPRHQQLARAKHHPGGIDDIHSKLMENPGSWTEIDNLDQINGQIFKKLPPVDRF